MGLKRAMKSECIACFIYLKFILDHPEKDTFIRGNPLKTFFVWNLKYRSSSTHLIPSEQTTDESLFKHFSRYARIKQCRVVRDLGMSYLFNTTYEWNNNGDYFIEIFFVDSH